MAPLEAALLVVALFLPFHLLVMRELRRLDDPRGAGVVIVSEQALDGHAERIGEYMGHPIWASVTFQGLRYGFDRVVARSQRERVAARELYLDPGLVYLAD